MARFARWLQSPLPGALLAGLVAFAGVTALRSQGAFQVSELAAYDANMKLSSTNKPVDVPIVLITVGESDIQRIKTWPLPDGQLAELLLALVRDGARVTGLDLYRDLPVPPGTDRLERVLRENDRIIAVEKFAGAGAVGVAAPPVLQGTSQVGFNDLVVDADGVVRRGLLFLDDGQRVAYAFALRLALRYLEKMDIRPQPDVTEPEHLRLGQTTFAPIDSHYGAYVAVDARGYQILIDFADGPNPFPTYSLTDVQEQRIRPDVFRDKIVILGAAAESVKDLFLTPNRRWLGASEAVPGAVLHAHLTSQLLRAALYGREPVGALQEPEEALWILLWSLLGALAGRWIRLTSVLVMTVIAGILMLGAIAHVAFLAGWWIPVAAAAAAWIGSAALAAAYMYSFEWREFRLLRRLFASQVSPEVAETIWKERYQLVEGGRLRPRQMTATVLFSDIQGFTAIAETLKPPLLMEWLNAYMDAMSRVVMEHEGVVDDYAGDGIKANFGVPIGHTAEADIRKDARSAVRCALAMRHELSSFNAQCERQNLPPIRMRIGIHTGLVVVGTLGSPGRVKFTTVGDTVNVASRLESVGSVPLEESSAEALCRVLVSDVTRGHLGDDFTVRRLGDLSLKGKSRLVTVYLVTDLAGSPA